MIDRRPIFSQSGAGLAIFVTWFAFYMLTGSRERPWGDAQVMWDVAVSMADRGAVDIAFEWPPMSHKGEGGRVYSQYALLPSVVQLPGAYLWLLCKNSSASLATFMWPFCCHLAPAACGAWVASRFYSLSRRLGVGQRAAIVSTVALCLSTGLWVYSRYAYSEALQAACALGFVDALWRFCRDPRPRQALWFGVWAGLLVHAKLVFALSVGAAAVLATYVVWRNRRRGLLRCWLAALAGALPLAVIWGLYNHIRWGAWDMTGYESTVAMTAGESVLWGLWGLFGSPGKSVFLYNLPLVLAIFGWRRLATQERLFAASVAVTTVPVVLLYSSHLNWGGGYCWGPRYLLFAVPLWMFGFSTLCEPVGEGRFGSRLRALCIVAALVCGGAVQVLGNAFYWDHYIRIANEAKVQWLGSPDRSGARIPARGRGHCDSCFEDMHALLWLPPFSPVEGHRWLLHHRLAGDDWRRAEQAAPWHRFTTKSVSIKRTYRRARWDWWVFLWLDDLPKYRALGIFLSCILALGVVAGATGWYVRTRPGDSG